MNVISLWFLSWGCLVENSRWECCVNTSGCDEQGSFCVCTQPTRDDVTMQRRLSLAGCIHKMIPEGSNILVRKYGVATFYAVHTEFEGKGRSAIFWVLCFISQHRRNVHCTQKKMTMLITLIMLMTQVKSGHVCHEGSLFVMPVGPSWVAACVPWTGMQCVYMSWYNRCPWGWSHYLSVK